MYDPKCYDLAALFASDLRPDPTEAEKAELAQIIQDAIEDWMSSKESARAEHPAEHGQFGVGA